MGYVADVAVYDPLLWIERSSNEQSAIVVQRGNEQSTQTSHSQQQRSPPLPSSSAFAGYGSQAQRRDMHDAYHAWALKTYGDSAKTKTVTRKKYARIAKILKGEELNSAENSKFRFWVKAKGFRIGPPSTVPTAVHPDGDLGDAATKAHSAGNDQVLYVPCAQTKNADGKEETVYKKVAVVENFFDIIYNVHVEMDGRGGKHAGQKRTYKAIAETFAFLPREAVTKFLMQCADCQKRMHAGTPTNDNSNSNNTTSNNVNNSSSSYHDNNANSNHGNSNTTASNASSKASPGHGTSCSGANTDHVNDVSMVTNSVGTNCITPSGTTPPQIDFSLPITTTYLKHMRSLGYSEEDALNPEREAHFDASQFELSRLDRKRKLKPNAIPTVFHLDSNNTNSSCNSVPTKQKRKQSIPKKKVRLRSGTSIIFGDTKKHSSKKSKRRKKECASIAESDSSGIHSTPPGESDASPAPQVKEEGEVVVGMRPTSTAVNGVSCSTNTEHSYDRPVNMTKAADGLSSSRASSPASATAAHANNNSNGHDWPSTPASTPLNMSKNAGGAEGAMTRDPAVDARSLMDHTYDESVVMMVLPSPRAQSPCSGRMGREATATPEDLSSGIKDEDDDDDDDDNEKLDIHKYDPERLKAFNMFVRLFVDENLDRMVPISKQPKEKIQAIIDSCNRQFPEFAERARKRIRTYLKSCRRTKRSRDHNGWDLVRPTPPHLTSAMAEQILAAACENESNNAKRMRLGLEPISASIQGIDKENGPVQERGRIPIDQSAEIAMAHGTSPSSRLHSPVRSLSDGASSLPSPQLNGTLPNSAAAIATYRALTPSATAASPLTPTTNGFSNGPTDLSVKKPLGGCAVSTTTTNNSKCSLNPSEVLAVKQLIAGYRESAAFLIRSADELEQLLLHHN